MWARRSPKQAGFASFSLWIHTRVASIVCFYSGPGKIVREKHTLKIPIFHTILFTLFYGIYLVVFNLSVVVLIFLYFSLCRLFYFGTHLHIKFPYRIPWADIPFNWNWPKNENIAWDLECSSANLWFMSYLVFVVCVFSSCNSSVDNAKSEKSIFTIA